ncbi:MAG: acyltransferase family protein [Deltaproteobacteria bacterium]|nr:acyltransferase family protein [Deltaproteobacteria bacterium]
MGQRTALLRLAESARHDVAPLARRLVAAARGAVDRLAERTLGADFDDRTGKIRDYYAERGGDPFGFDPVFTRYTAMFGAALHRLYFRTEVHGIENVPAGRALLIANHSGQVPIDGMMIAMAMLMDADPPRSVRSMVEKWAQTLPFVSMLFSRTGQVVGVPENCRRLLDDGELILAFPEGIRGISKPFTKRYQLEEFGSGFLRLAIETGAPVVPVAVIGAEEQYVSVGSAEQLARSLGMPVLPVIPQLLLPGGLLPLPTKYRIYFGEPLRFDGDPDDDDDAIEQKVWLVRQTIQNMLNRGLRDRKSVFT